MKIQVAKQDLENSLEVVSACLAGTGSDLSAHFLFRRNPKDREKAQVLTYTTRISALCPVTAQVEESDFDAFTVEGWRLKKWLGTLPDAALTFEFDGAVVEATCPGKGVQKFQSLDPSKFPYWDKLLTEAEGEILLISAERLHRAIDYSRNFASDNESRTPELCVCEVKEGVLASTNKRTATLVKVQGLKKSAMRVHVKDAPAILSFLSSIKGDVEVMEHDKCLFLRRADGAVFEESRFDANFPAFNEPPDVDPHWWILDTEELRSAIPFLVSGANREDDRLRFTRPGDPNDKERPVIVSMYTATGSTAEQKVTCVKSDSEPDAEPLPDEGFVLAYPNLLKILQFVKSDTIRFGVSRRKKNGYLRFKDTQFADADGKNGDEYLTVAAWLR